MLKLIITLCFIITTITCFAQTIEKIGENISKGKAYAISLNSGTSMQLAYTELSEDKQIHVKSFSGNEWKENSLLPDIAKAGGDFDIIESNGTTYVFYEGYSGMTLLKYNGEQKKWLTEGKPEFAADISAYDPKICIFEELPYIIYENKTADIIDMHALVKKDNLHIWSSMDAMDKIPKGAEQPDICQYNKAIHLAWFDRDKGEIGLAKVSDNQENLEMRSKGLPNKGISNFIGLSTSSKGLFLTYEDSRDDYGLKTLKYNEDKKKWEAFGGEEKIKGKYFQMHPDLTVTVLSEEGKVLYYEYDGRNSAWKAPQVINEGKALSVSSCVEIPGKIVVAYILEDGQIEVKRIKV